VVHATFLQKAPRVPDSCIIWSYDQVEERHVSPETRAGVGEVRFEASWLRFQGKPRVVLPTLHYIVILPDPKPRLS